MVEVSLEFLSNLLSTQVHLRDRFQDFTVKSAFHFESILGILISTSSFDHAFTFAFFDEYFLSDLNEVVELQVLDPHELGGHHQNFILFNFSAEVVSTWREV